MYTSQLHIANHFFFLERVVDTSVTFLSFPTVLFIDTSLWRHNFFPAYFSECSLVFLLFCE